MRRCWRRIEAGRPPYAAVSDFEGPYAAMPPDAPVPRYGYGPTLLPPQEVYTVVRDNGFSPLGIPQQRGFVYTIAVIDRGGDDGRLVIDARNGRIVRFMPAYRMGDNFNEDMTEPMARPGAAADQPGQGRAAAAGLDPACREPHGAGAEGEARSPQKPAAASRRRAIGRGAGEAGRCATDPARCGPTVGQAKPAAPPILPTQEMPKVQGLD